jgi:TetR/AcrR family transcriptional regulator, transcriptional repressor for nem operon
MVRSVQGARSDTAERILDVAERLVQVGGYNGFSYADVAVELGLTKASLHYHFAGKAELGEALIARYAERFATALGEIAERPADAHARLEAYVDLYAQVLREGRMCLCGMLAAEYQTLPTTMRQEVLGFFDANEGWLERVLAAGQKTGELRFTGDPAEAARNVVSTLEGAMLLARSYSDVSRFDAAAHLLLVGLTDEPTR